MITLIIICIVVITIGIGAYVIWKHSGKAEDVPNIPPIACDPNCKLGCNPDGTCMTPTCNPPFILDKNDNTCVCPPGVLGANCQCDPAKKPTDTPTDECNGFGYICTDVGWTSDPNSAKDCSELYNMNGGTENSFVEKCAPLICSADNGSYIQTLSCNGGKPACEQRCRDKPRPNDCAACIPTPGKAIGPADQVCNCDSTTGYAWSCAPKQNVQCGISPPPGLCSDGQPAICITCGPNDFAWHCPGAPQDSVECIEKQFRINQPSNSSGVKYPFYEKTDETPHIPVFPAFNNDLCKKRYMPYTLLPMGDDYYGYKSLQTTPGFVEYENDGQTVKSFIEKSDSSNLIYNVKSQDTENAWGYIQDSTTRNISNLQNNSNIQGQFGVLPPVDVSDDLMITNGMGCRRNRAELCSGRGSFTQDCFDEKGKNLEVCIDGSFRGDTGKCSCNNDPVSNPSQLYKGLNCEFGRADTCTSHGNPDDLGNCKCDQGWVGNKCQFSNTITCLDQGTVNNDGTCNYDISKVMPRCEIARVGPNTSANGILSNVQPSDYNNIICSKTVNPKGYPLPIYDQDLCVKKNNSTNGVYGCPIKPDATAWTPYTGATCHYNDSDPAIPTAVNCIAGSNVCRALAWGESGYMTNYCQVPSVFTINKLYNISNDGLTDEPVSGAAQGHQNSWAGTVVTNQGASFIDGRLWTDYFQNTCFTKGSPQDNGNGSVVDPNYVFGACRCTPQGGSDC